MAQGSSGRFPGVQCDQGYDPTTRDGVVIADTDLRDSTWPRR
jgi:hypothetical protein